MSIEHTTTLMTYKRLMGYAVVYWRVFLISIIGMVIVAASETGFAALMKPMLDGSFVEKDPDTIRLIPLILIGIFIIRAVAMFVSAYGMAWIGRKMILQFRDQMFEKLLNFPSPVFDRTTSGELISKFTYDVEQVATASTKAVTVLIRDTLTVIGLLGWMFYLNVMLSLFFVVVGPVIAALVVVVSKRFRKISRRIQNSMGQVTHLVEEAIAGQRVVKIFGGHEYEKMRFHGVNQRNQRQQMKMVATSASSTPVIQLIVSLALAAIIYLASMENVVNEITVGTFMSFIVAMSLLFAPIKRLTAINADLQRGITAATSVFRLLDTDGEKDTGTHTIEQVAGEICYQNVRFAYAPDKSEVLKGIDLRIECGQTVAFVGRSGSGKSTLVNLLPRFYEIQEGQILLDGVDIREYRLAVLRDQIAYVGQDVMLFNDTLGHNIAYGSKKKTDIESIIRAAKAAHAWEFIEKLPEGLDTVVGEKGVMLSGGQRQRVAIARALLKNAPILILDEATSALDTESERHIQAALEELVKGRTTLVIAHRLSTIENADRIAVMDNGQIIEIGSHKALMEKNGHYAALHRMQFADSPSPAPSNSSS